MKQSSIYKSTISVTIMVVIFKLFAFVKQAIIAAIFGTTLQTDAFFLASEFVIGLGEAIVKSVSMSMISIYTFLRIQEGREKSSRLISGLMIIMLPIAIFLSAMFIAFAPLIAKALAPAYSQSQLDLLALFIRLLSGMFVFSAFELIGVAVLDSEKKFVIPRLQSLVNSIVVIVASLLLYEIYGVFSLVIAQYVSSILFVILLWFTVRKYVHFQYVLPRHDAYVRRVFKLAIPLLIGNSAIYFNQVIGKAIASKFDAGTVSTLAYSHVLEQLVTSVMIVNIGNVMFSHFSNFLADKQDEKVRDTLIRTLNILISLLTFITLIVLFRAREIVMVVYYRGNFTMESVERTAMLLQGLAIGFVAIAVRDILAKSMYAYQNTRVPARNSIVSMIINIVLSLYLSRVLEVMGIVIGSSISVFIGAGMNIISFKRLQPSFSFSSMWQTIWKNGIALLVSAGALFIMGSFIEYSHPLLPLLLETVVAGILYLAVLYLLGVQEVHTGFDRLKCGILDRGRRRV